MADLGTQGMLAGYDSAMRGTVDPVARAEIAAEREYAVAVSEGADAEEAAARAALARSRALADLAAGIADVIRQQDQQLARLQMEAALAGQTEASRARALAIFDADQQIRDLGATGADAEIIRQSALATADQRIETERLAAAWDRVRQAAEGAIDGPIDAILKGDFEGALSGLAQEIGGLFADLAIKNPLKNGLLGTDLPTMDDVGGLQGILRSLIGGEPMPQTVSSMDITAASVTLGGVGVAGIFDGGMPTAANLPMAPGMVGLGGSPGVQDQIWRFFAARGLQPHQIAAIMGNVQAESAFDPLARGDVINGQPTSFGLFQHHAGRGQGLLGAVGGQGGLGNVEAQLQYVWQELLSSENGVLQRLMASTNVRDATAAFVGFERPQGWSAADPTGAHNWTWRLGAAEEALARFGATASTAQADLGLLGQGFGAFGNALAGIGQGGGGENILLQLLGLAGQAFGLGGFKVGGPTGGSNPDRIAGVVHEEEFVFDAEATRRIGVSKLEAIRRGGQTSRSAGTAIIAGAPLPAANQAAAPAVIHLQPIFEDHTSGGVRMETETWTDARGQPQQKYIFSDAVAAGLGARGGAARKALAGMGLRERPRDRG